MNAKEFGFLVLAVIVGYVAYTLVKKYLPASLQG